MAVVVDSGPVSPEDLLRHVPESRWRELMLVRRDFMQVRLSHDCRCLVQFVKDAKAMYKPLGFASAEEMIRTGYELEPEEIKIALRWLELNPSEEPVPLETAVKLGRHGRPTKEERENKGGMSTLMPEDKNTRTHWLARLDRDRPDLAGLVRAGGLSANSAAIRAGFRRKTITVPFDVDRAAATLIRHFGDDALTLARMIEAQYQVSGR